MHMLYNVYHHSLKTGTVTLVFMMTAHNPQPSITSRLPWSSPASYFFIFGLYQNSFAWFTAPKKKNRYLSYIGSSCSTSLHPQSETSHLFAAHLAISLLLSDFLLLCLVSANRTCCLWALPPLLLASRFKRKKKWKSTTKHLLLH